MNILGYCTFYIRAEYEDEENAYFKWESNFTKALTESALEEIVSSFETAALRLRSIPAKCIFVSKEEYEANKSDKELEYLFDYTNEE